MRPASAFLLAALSSVLWLGIPGALAGQGEKETAGKAAAEATTAEETPAAAVAAEERYELLTAELAAALDERVVAPEADEVLLVELEELRAVAEEILIEGDVETAVLLLEEALALLPAHGGE